MLLQLTYKNVHYYAKTFTTFIDYFPELEVWSTKVYNNRMELKEDNFSVKKIEILPRLKKVLNDKRVKKNKK